MRLLFKFLGLAVIFSVCALWGLLKSLNLKKRYDRLCVFSRSLSTLAEHILTNSGEIEKVIPKCFEDSLVYIKDNKAVYDRTFLKAEDTALLDELFNNIGRRDTKSECDRIGLYINLITKKSEEAKDECERLCRLYNTLGIFSGIFICIFFL